MFTKATRTSLRKVFWVWVAPVAGLAALALAVYLYCRSPQQRTYHLSMTAGNPLGMRHNLARMLRAEALSHGIQLELHGTKGSDDALDQVDRHDLDVALVQGGLQKKGWSHVRQVATLHVEPLHLLVKKELFEKVSAHLAALDGKTVNLSEAGSGTHDLAVEVLAFVGLHPRGAGRSGGYIPMALSRQQLYATKDAARLPDAFFLVVSLPSPAVKYLVGRHGYRLVTLPFGEAFGLGALTGAPASGERGDGPQVDKGHIYPVSIPAFTYGVDPPEPPAALPTLGTRLLLVAHEDVDPHAVRELVQATLAGKVGKLDQAAKLMTLPPEFPWHEGARLYQKHNRPLLSGDVVDWARKGFTIFAAAVSGLFVLWQWRKQSDQGRKDAAFNHYLHQVTRIEELAAEIEHGGPGGTAALFALRDRLAQLKSEALLRFAEGELTGKELLAGFLVHANAGRDYLNRLIRQQEEQPREAGHPPKQWPPYTRDEIPRVGEPPKG
jgi:TRAP-type uncharacterized transport system substrate-binding protein